MFELNNRQKVVVEHVLQELLSKGTNELNKTFGTFTIQEMQDLYSRLHYADFCEKHGIAYDDMTEADYEQAYREAWEA